MKRVTNNFLVFSFMALCSINLAEAMALTAAATQAPMRSERDVTTSKDFSVKLVVTSGDASLQYSAEKALFIDAFTQAYLEYIRLNDYPVLDKETGIGAWIKDGETPEQALRRTLDGVMDCNDPEDLGEIQQVQKGDCSMITAYHNGEVVGFITTKQDNGVYMSQLAVKNEFKRKGIATALISEVFRLNPEDKTFYIIVRLFNTGSQNLYRKIGFKPSAYMRGGYSDKKYMGLELSPTPIQRAHLAVNLDAEAGI